MNGRISARIVSAAVLGQTLVLASSCARETPGHCAFADGDGTCEAAYEGTFCIFQGPGFVEHAAVEYRNVSEAQRLGCYESQPVTPAGEDMGMEFFACVPNGLMDGDDRLRDMRALNKGKKDGKTYDLAAFLADYGVTPQVHASGCQPGAGTTSTDASDTGSTTFGTEDSTTDGMSSESSTTGPMRCMGNEDCPELDAPQCLNGECMACVDGADGDAACAGLDATKPLCAGGSCVQCTAAAHGACTGDTPVCDDTTNTCVPCTEHDQCGSGACELAVGRCFPDGTILTVDGDAAMPSPPLYATISAAIAAVPAGDHGVIVVHELDGGSTYQTAGVGLRVDGGKTIALLAAPGESPIVLGTGANPGLRVSAAGTTLYMDGLSVSGHTSGLGMLVDLGAFAWVDRSRIVQNSAGGILVQNSSELTLRNCFVGGDVNDIAAFTVNGSTAAILYTTAGAGFGTATALMCDAGATVEARNSLFVARTDGDEIVCDATIEQSAAELDLGGTNIALGTMATIWFQSYGMGNFTLSGNQPADIATAAQWQAGDPTTDIGGDPRPTVDGAADYAGADRP